MWWYLYKKLKTLAHSKETCEIVKAANIMVLLYLLR